MAHCALKVTCSDWITPLVMRHQEVNVLFSKYEQFAMSDTKLYTRTAKKKLINKIDIDFVPLKELKFK